MSIYQLLLKEHIHEVFVAQTLLENLFVSDTGDKFLEDFRLEEGMLTVKLRGEVAAGVCRC